MDAQTTFELYIRSRNFYFDCLYADMNCSKAKLMVMEVPMKYFLVTNVLLCAVQWLSVSLPISVALSVLIFFYYIRSGFMHFSSYRQSRIRVNELHNYCKRVMQSVDFHRLVVIEKLTVFSTGGVPYFIIAEVVSMLIYQAVMLRLLFAVSGRSQ